MSFIQLTNKQQEIIYKSIKDEKLQQIINANNDRFTFMRLFPKQFHHLKVKDIQNFIENNPNSKDFKRCVVLIEHCYDFVVAAKCKNYPKVLSKLRKLENVDDEIKAEIAQFKEEYAESELRLEYNALILFMLRHDSLYEMHQSVLSEEEIIKIEEVEEEKVNPLQEVVDDLKAQLELKKKEVKSLKAMYAIENISFRISQVLDINQEFKSYEEVYAYLGELEQNAYVEQDFALIKKILSVKYAIINLIGGNKHE